MTFQNHASFPGVERRRDDDSRTLTVYRPCALEIGECLYPGLVRNVSEYGAQIEIFGDFEDGASIIYDDGVRGAIEGHILWRKGGLYGIRNVARASVYTERYFERGNSYRSIRIPVELASTAWIEGQAKSSVVSNISLSGAQIDGLIPADLKVGSLCTIKVASVGEVACTVRWVGPKSFGVKFSKSLNIKQLSEILNAVRQAKSASTALAA
ncbi:PilZ domain-containing protein [Croceicoccus gelatinilyticus]|uniref:PilZ domain-containing protein n=1 Tax=Croceicoccus gelatinilyticus TaxID=2835536 RepID=UPI001BCA96B2|nr:PilZ domain-containing protein [Croceicoccus gelatinilyticus]MBS7671585.1 PilZ domain-containing protein [Croceicoccus gelatinilyticus]